MSEEILDWETLFTRSIFKFVRQKIVGDIATTRYLAKEFSINLSAFGVIQTSI